ncbi:MAG: HDOD domain-containing protein [Colwellia sp.]|nr:HDOD domain-containing protein [Colwellia sp.]MCW8865847.1 HDOD domain-containing protein [Colwellia sp.]MCW9082115.1 HDOD domain-containing protein [Colwellia sp.]
MNAIDYAEQASELFVLSESFLRIKELIDNESSTIDDISEVILIDPALAASILKLANSSFFSYPGKIDTISKAVLVLGITEVYNLVIAYFVTKAFNAVTADKQYLENFWEQSVDCALIIKYLSSSLNVANAERLFILGLLHNIGELIIQQISPEKIPLCQSDDINTRSWQKQQAVLGFTYADCSSELLKLWQLPYNLIAPIRNQNETDFEQINIESQLLCVAKNVMLSQQNPVSVNFSTLISEQQLSHLSINEKTLTSAIDYCDLERLGILSILSPSSAMIY